MYRSHISPLGISDHTHALLIVQQVEGEMRISIGRSVMKFHRKVTPLFLTGFAGSHIRACLDLIRD